MLCLLCGAGLPPGCATLCPGCSADLPRIDAACTRCGRKLPASALCGACAVRLPVYDRAIACFEYRPPVDSIIREFKYSGRLAWTPFLTDCMAASVRAAGSWRPECLVPVPLHWRRRYLRGFNQATELARGLGKIFVLPVDHGLVRRNRATPSQAELPAAGRRRNLRGAFTTSEACAWRRVAIVEDVITTGATVSELSRALKRAGVAEIRIWSIARAE